MLNQQQIKELNRFATQIRIETIREIASLGKGHVGGTLSLAEVLAVLYGGVMKIDPANPGWEGRDGTGWWYQKVMLDRQSMRRWLSKDIFPWGSCRP
jgi:hypothetical protein